MNLGGILFPHEEIRKLQMKLLAQTHYAVNHREDLVVHAPTGIGKTAAVLAPALTYAIENDKVVLFLTSRHTQHQIAIDTLREVKEKHGDSDFNAVDVVGKKHLCLQPGVTKMSSGEFAEYCRKMREDEMCEYYLNLKKGEKASPQTMRTLGKLKGNSPQETHGIMDASKEEKVCPYEISMLLAKDSEVVITDYFYVFNPKIRDSFLKRIGKELADVIIIVDEAHNLPGRLKDMPSKRITSISLKLAAKEAREHDEEIADAVEKMRRLFEGYSAMCDEEMYLERSDFRSKVNNIYQYDKLWESMQDIGGKIREEEKRSSLANVGEFLEAWDKSTPGFTRIFSKKEGSQGPILEMHYKCLDPSLVTREVVTQAHSTIMMSGTLTPTSMYTEILGMDDPIESEYDNPFPEKNKLSMIIPKTTTKYAARGEQQYRNIASILADAINEIPGNSTVFFPSYYLKDQVKRFLEEECEKTVFNEVQGMSKKDKHDFLKNFKKYKDTGAVLLGVASGSFGEGIDLPGDYLKGVIVVGLPLTKPDLEVKALIDYYDDKFGKGWDYGYLYPAFNKTMQAAGRCIRSATDKGVVIYLDERYAWNNYLRLFPKDVNPKITMNYKQEIRDFFGKK